KSFVRVVKDRPITELSLMESIQDEYITRHQMDGKILYTDHRISFVTGLMPGEVLGSSAFNYMHSEDMLWSIVAQKQMFSSSQGQGIVSYRLQCRDGQYVTLRSRGFLEVNKQTGQVDTFVCINTVLSVRETAEDEIRNQRRKLLPMISCQESENLLNSISSSLPPELFNLLKPLLNPETVQRMIDSLDKVNLDLDRNSKIKFPSSNNACNSNDFQERWQDDGWEEINPNHPPPKPLPPPGRIQNDMMAEDHINVNKQWYSMNPKKRNQDGKNYFPPSKKVSTLSSHSEQYSSYSHSENHKQNYGMDGQTHFQQNLRWQLDGTQMLSGQPVGSPQTKRFCPDTNNIGNSFASKGQNNNCSISSPLDALSPMSHSSYSTFGEDDPNSTCSVESPSVNDSPLSVESCISTIFGSPVNSMCSNFDDAADSNTDNNRYMGTSDTNIANNHTSGMNDNNTVSHIKSYDGTNNSNIEMGGIAGAISRPECISPSICTGQQQLTIHSPTIAQVRSPGGMVCTPAGIVHSPGLSSPTDFQCSVSSKTHPMSPTQSVFFQSQSTLPEQDCNLTQISPFKKPHNKIQTNLPTSYQTQRSFHQPMMRNSSNSNSFPSNGNGQLLISQRQQTQEHYNLQNPRLGISMEEKDYFTHQHTPDNIKSVTDEPYTVTEEGQQGNNTSYLNSLSSNMDSSRIPPPPKPPHPTQLPEAPRYNLQQHQQQSQQQQHRGKIIP
ncbi:unnamed protein product, partial [Meganyctiphanes norvegica]